LLVIAQGWSDTVFESGECVSLLVKVSCPVVVVFHWIVWLTVAVDSTCVA